jgi:hypothetical protein
MYTTSSYEETEEILKDWDYKKIDLNCCNTCQNSEYHDYGRGNYLGCSLIKKEDWMNNGHNAVDELGICKKFIRKEREV